jgi:hypothetical protein
MENKKTALNWILERLSPYIHYPYAHSAGYDLEELIEQAKAMEKEQIKEAYIDGCIGEMYELSATYTAEEYYNATYANDTTKRLPKEDSKRRGWHY